MTPADYRKLLTEGTQGEWAIQQALGYIRRGNYTRATVASTGESVSELVCEPLGLDLDQCRGNAHQIATSHNAAKAFAQAWEALDELVAEFDTRNAEMMEVDSCWLEDTGGIALARAALARLAALEVE